MDFIDAKQRHYSRAKNLYRRTCVAVVIVFATSLLSVVPAIGNLASWLAVVAFGAAIIAFVYQQLASSHTSEADKFRRLAMLNDGLGLQPSPAQLAKLQVSLANLENREFQYLPPYYESQAPKGARRLIEIVAECPFFSGSNARYYAKCLLGAIGAGILVFLLIFLALVFVSSDIGTVRIAAQMLVVSATALVTGNLIVIALAFWKMADDCDEVLAAADQHRSTTDDDDGAAILLFVGYNSAVSNTPPIPTWLYELRRDLLNKAWRDHRPASAPSERGGGH